MERVGKAAACGARQGAKTKDLGGRKKYKGALWLVFTAPSALLSRSTKLTASSAKWLEWLIMNCFK